MDEIAESFYIWTEKHQKAIKVFTAGLAIIGLIMSTLIEQGVIG